MNTATAVAEAPVRPPVIEELPAELLGMAWELYRLSQAGSAGKTFAGVEAPIVDVCRRMGTWAMETALALHPKAAPGREHECPRCSQRFRILRETQHRKLQGRLGDSAQIN